MSDFPDHYVSKGTSLWTVHSARRAGTSFNPNENVTIDDPSSGGRFHPSYDASENPVPSLYVADHSNGAFAETMMRDDARTRSLTKQDVFRSALSLLRPTRKLRFANLSYFDDDDIQEALTQGRDAYVTLRIMAQTLYRTHPQFDGVAWYNKQLATPGMYSYVIFGSQTNNERDRTRGYRVDENDIEVIKKYPFDSKIGRTKLIDAASAREFNLPRSLRLQT